MGSEYEIYFNNDLFCFPLRHQKRSNWLQPALVVRRCSTEGFSLLKTFALDEAKCQQSRKNEGKTRQKEWWQESMAIKRKLSQQAARETLSYWSGTAKQDTAIHHHLLLPRRPVSFAQVQHFPIVVEKRKNAKYGHWFVLSTNCTEGWNPAENICVRNDAAESLRCAQTKGRRAAAV